MHIAMPKPHQTLLINRLTHTPALPKTLQCSFSLALQLTRRQPSTRRDRTSTASVLSFRFHGNKSTTMTKDEGQGRVSWPWPQSVGLVGWLVDVAANALTGRGSGRWL